VNYSYHMIEIHQTEVFADWLRSLRDKQGQKRIVQRLVRLEAGLLGDTKAVGGGVSELRINYGPGYRVYFTRRGNALVILICGGDKSSQARDIAKAQQMVKELE